MTIDERKVHLRIEKKQYVKASRKEKGGIRDEMAQVAGCHRKHEIQLVGGSLQRPRRQGRVQPIIRPCAQARREGGDVARLRDARAIRPVEEVTQL
jgi:hypothetical protein